MKIVIIGMGPAGVNVAKTLRNNGFRDSIVMFSSENVPPYSPPALGEYLITGNEETLFWQGKDFSEKYHVSCQAGNKIVQIMPKEQMVKTESGERFNFDYLVIASGSSLYAPVKGFDKKGIFEFKTMGSVNKIKEIASKGKAKNAVVVGGGFIGVEIALWLAKIGITPSLLNRRSWIMPRLLDVETAKYVENDLRAQGVEVMLNTEGKEFIGNKKIESLVTSDDRSLKADIYIAATGVKPNIEFILNSDIKFDQGIIVNEKLQTNLPNIYACGDVAETVDLISKGSKIHGLYPVAVSHAKTVAYNILGRDNEYEKQVNMNSIKGLGFKIIVAGEKEGEEMRLQSEGVLRKIYVKNDRISAFTLLGDISNAGIYLSLLAKRVNISKYKNKLLSAGFNPGFIF